MLVVGVLVVLVGGGACGGVYMLCAWNVLGVCLWVLVGVIVGVVSFVFILPQVESLKSAAPTVEGVVVSVCNV